ncbi:MAG: hypothetical protein ABIM89_13285, partial [Mycobacteriales bacterium]
MSTPTQRPAPDEPAVAKRLPGPSAGGPMMGRGPAAMMGGISAEKPLDFKRSSRRVLELLHPQRATVVLVFLLGITQVTFAVLGPRLLGRATDLIF